MSLTMTLNQAKLGTSVDVTAFPPLTKEQLLADLAESEDDIKHGRVKDAFVSMNELAEKYGL